MGVSLVVPAYNEEDEVRELLNHLSSIQAFEEIFVIDDGSTDSTSEVAINELARSSGNVQFVRLEENTDKVGALATGVGLANSEFVMHTDADTQIRNPEKVSELVSEIKKTSIEGFALQVLPENDESRRAAIWSILQDLDYSVGRVAHFFTTGSRLRLEEKKRNVRCVPGAGGLYHRKALLEALQEHSGKHPGDDMETTARAQFQEGLKLGYSNKIRFVTKAPGSYRELLSQRIRWNRGALQLFNQQRREYLKEMISFSRYGLLSVYELLLSFLVPFLFVFLAISALQAGPERTIELVGNMYALELGLSGLMCSYSLMKGDIGKKESILMTPILPAYRMAIFYPAKIVALSRFLTEKLKYAIKSGGSEEGVRIPQAVIYDRRKARKLLESENRPRYNQHPDKPI